MLDPFEKSRTAKDVRPVVDIEVDDLLCGKARRETEGDDPAS
jgi:hypothetical protein